MPVQTGSTDFSRRANLAGWPCVSAGYSVSLVKSSRPSDSILASTAYACFGSIFAASKVSLNGRGTWRPPTFRFSLAIVGAGASAIVTSCSSTIKSAPSGRGVRSRNDTVPLTTPAAVPTGGMVPCRWQSLASTLGCAGSLSSSRCPASLLLSVVQTTALFEYFVGFVESTCLREYTCSFNVSRTAFVSTKVASCTPSAQAYMRLSMTKRMGGREICLDGEGVAREGGCCGASCVEESVACRLAREEEAESMAAAAAKNKKP